MPVKANAAERRRNKRRGVKALLALFGTRPGISSGISGSAPVPAELDMLERVCTRETFSTFSLRLSVEPGTGSCTTDPDGHRWMPLVAKP